MDFPPNSHKDKKNIPEKNLQKVITGEVIQRRKPFGRKFKDVFFGGDFKTAIAYVYTEIFVPSLRNMMADAGKGAIDRVFYGESRYPSSRMNQQIAGQVQYNRISNLGRDPRSVYLPDQPPHRVGGRRSDQREIILASREDAEMVLEQLTDIIDKYQVASLSDLYAILGLESSHVDQKWGWYTVAASAIRQIRDGWLLDLPVAEPI